MEVPHRLGSLVVLFILAVIFIDDSVCTRHLQERQLPVMSHLPQIIPTLPKPEFLIIPKVNFPPIKELRGFPKIAWPDFPGGPKCHDKPQEPQVPKQPLIPDSPYHPEPKEPKVPENPKLPAEPEVPELPHPIVPEKPEKPLSEAPPKEPNDLEFPWLFGGHVLPSSVRPPAKMEESPPVTAP